MRSRVRLRVRAGVSKSQIGQVGSSGLSELGAAEVAIAALMLSFADKTVNAPG